MLPTVAAAATGIIATEAIGYGAARAFAAFRKGSQPSAESYLANAFCSYPYLAAAKDVAQAAAQTYLGTLILGAVGVTSLVPAGTAAGMAATGAAAIGVALEMVHFAMFVAAPWLAPQHSGATAADEAEIDQCEEMEAIGCHAVAYHFFLLLRKACQTLDIKLMRSLIPQESDRIQACLAFGLEEMASAFADELAIRHADEAAIAQTIGPAGPQRNALSISQFQRFR